MPCDAPADIAGYLEPSTWASVERGPSGRTVGAGAEIAGGVRFEICDRAAPSYVDVGVLLDGVGWSNAHGATALEVGLGLEAEAGFHVFDAGDLGVRLAIVERAFTPYDVGSRDAFFIGGRFRLWDVKLGLDGFYSPPSSVTGYGVVGSLGLTHKPGALTSAAVLGIALIVTTVTYASLVGRPND